MASILFIIYQLLFICLLANFPIFFTTITDTFLLYLFNFQNDFISVSIIWYYHVLLLKYAQHIALTFFAFEKFTSGFSATVLKREVVADSKEILSWNFSKAVTH